MSSGDLRTELTLPIVTPAASEGTGEGRSRNTNSERKTQRRSRFENDGSEETPPSIDSDVALDNDDPHQLDRLA
jgi:hypothetical protein